MTKKEFQKKVDEVVGNVITAKAVKEKMGGEVTIPKVMADLKEIVTEYLGGDGK